VLAHDSYLLNLAVPVGRSASAPCASAAGYDAAMAELAGAPPTYWFARYGIGLLPVFYAQIRPARSEHCRVAEAGPRFALLPRQARHPPARQGVHRGFGS